MKKLFSVLFFIYLINLVSGLGGLTNITSFTFEGFISADYFAVNDGGVGVFYSQSNASVFYLDYGDLNEVTSNGFVYNSSGLLMTLPDIPTGSSMHIRAGTRDLYYFVPGAQKYYSYNGGTVSRNLPSSQIAFPFRSYFYPGTYVGETALYTLFYYNSQYQWLKSEPGLPYSPSYNGAIPGNFNASSGFVFDYSNKYVFIANDVDFYAIRFYTFSVSLASINLTFVTGTGYADGGINKLYICAQEINGSYGIAAFGYADSNLGPQFSSLFLFPTGINECTNVVGDGNGQLFASVRNTATGDIFIFTTAIDGTNKNLINITNGNVDNLVIGLKYTGQLVIGRKFTQNLATPLYLCPSLNSDACSGHGNCVYLNCQCAEPYDGIDCSNIIPVNTTSMSIDFENNTITLIGTKFGSDQEQLELPEPLTLVSLNDTIIIISYPENITNGEFDFYIGVQKGSLRLSFPVIINSLVTGSIDSEHPSIQLKGPYLGGSVITFSTTKGDKNGDPLTCSETYFEDSWTLICDFDKTGEGVYYITASSGKYYYEIEGNFPENSETEGSSDEVSGSSKLFGFILITILHIFISLFLM